MLTKRLSSALLLIACSACKPAATVGVTLASEPLIDFTEEGDVLVDVAMSGYKAQSEFEQKPTGFDAVIRRDEKDVAEAPMKAAEGGYAVAKIEKPDLTPGHYVIDVRGKAGALSRTTFDVANVPCIGDSKKKIVLTYGARVQASDTDKGFTIRPGRWLMRSGQKAWAARWLKEDSGTLITTTTGVDEAPEGLFALEEIDSRGAGPIACPIDFDTEAYEVPSAVLGRSGKYLARVVREEGEPLEIHFVVTNANEAGGPKTTKNRSKAGFSRRTTWATLEAKPFTPDAAFTASLASVPKKPPKRLKEKKGEIDNPLKVSSEEVRALVRKPELVDQRVAFNKLALTVLPKETKPADVKAHKAEVELTKKELVKAFHETGGEAWAFSEMKEAFMVKAPTPEPSATPTPAPSASASGHPAASAKKPEPPKKK